LPVDPVAVREWAHSLPDDPAAIERAVHERVRYAVPWQVAGVPWTLASPVETLAQGYGDCQARALVFASVLAAKGIPYQLRASIDHMWVEYAGKQATTLENAAKTLWSRTGNERAEQPALARPPATPAGARELMTPLRGLALRLPAIDLAESLRLEKEYFWDPAPTGHKLAGAGGLLLIWLGLPRWKAPRRDGRLSWALTSS
jgi:hypothetical protein